MTLSDDTREFMTPIPMILFCPACGLQHVDKDETANVPVRLQGLAWRNPPHRSHLCAGCGHIWRPSDVPTVGVAEIETRGKGDNDPVRRHAGSWTP